MHTSFVDFIKLDFSKYYTCHNFKSCRPIAWNHLQLPFAYAWDLGWIVIKVIIIYAWDLDLFSHDFKLDDLIELSGETLTRGKVGTKHASLTLVARSLDVMGPIKI